MIRPPQVIMLGPVGVRFYALCILAGIVGGYYLARPAARRIGLTPEALQLSIFYGVIPGVIGARLYHVIDYWWFYAAHPAQIPAVWNGGLGILGGLAAGAAGLWVFARQRKLGFLSLLDVWAPAALFGQAVGRLGNWANQEAFGPPTSLPWKIFIDPDHRPAQYADQSYFHPTFFYEAAWDGLGVIVLLLLRKRLRLRPGQLLGAYLVIYGTGRFVVEFFRFETASIDGLRVAHLIAVALVLAGVYFLALRPKRS